MIKLKESLQKLDVKKIKIDRSLWKRTKKTLRNMKKNGVLTKIIIIFSSLVLLATSVLPYIMK